MLNVIPIEIFFLPLFIITNITSGTLSASGALPVISAVMRTKGVRNLFWLFIFLAGLNYNLSTNPVVPQSSFRCHYVLHIQISLQLCKERKIIGTEVLIFTSNPTNLKNPPYEREGKVQQLS